MAGSESETEVEMANTPPREQEQDVLAAPATSSPLPGPARAFTRDDYSALATAVAHQHSESVVLILHHHVASKQVLGHGTGFIVWSSAQDCLILTANHVIKLDEYEKKDAVEIVVKMPGSCDYLPATMLQSDTDRDIALLQVTKNDGKKIGQPAALTFDERPPPPVGMVVVLLGYLAPESDIDGQAFVWPDVPASSPGKITSEARVGRSNTSKAIDNGLNEKIKASCASVEGCSGSPLIEDHKVVGLLTDSENDIDVFRTVLTITAVFRRWLLLEATDKRTANDIIPLLAAQVE